MTRPVSFFRIVTILLELYRRKWQGGNIYTISILISNASRFNSFDRSKSFSSFIHFFNNIPTCAILETGLIFFVFYYSCNALFNCHPAVSIGRSSGKYNWEEIMFGGFCYQLSCWMGPDSPKLVHSCTLRWKISHCCQCWRNDCLNWFVEITTTVGIWLNGIGITDEKPKITCGFKQVILSQVLF